MNCDWCVSTIRRTSRASAALIIQPKRRSRLLVAELHEHFAPSGAFNMNVRWLVLARRRVHVDAKVALVEHLDHEIG
jgi:hypothetical protein